MKKLNHILNIIIGAFVGVFIGHGIYVIWNFKTRPELYAMQSAPWYTSLLVYGAFCPAARSPLETPAWRYSIAHINRSILLLPHVQ